MAVVTRDEIVAAINASGLWASYGDAAALLGFGQSPRACATANWEMRARLARADGTSDADDETKGEHWIEANPDRVLVNLILGYPESQPKPAELRLSPADLLALAGLAPSAVGLRLRIWDQALLLEKWLDAAPLDAPHRQAVIDALTATRDLRLRLAGEAA